MEKLILGLQILDFLLLGLSVYFMVIIYRRSRGQADSVSMVYFLTTILLFIFIRAIFFFNDLGVHLEEMTNMAAWHLMFYGAVISMGIAAKLLSKKDATQAEVLKMSKMAKLSLAGMVIAALVVYLNAATFNEAINTLLEDTWIDQSGIFHLVAFVLSFRTGGLILGMRAYSSRIKLAAWPLTAALIFYAIVHAWELFTESWGMFALPHEVIEDVEEFLVPPIFIACAIAFYRIFKNGKKITPVAPVENPLDSISVSGKIGR